MSEARVASRYAKSLLVLSVEQGVIEKTLADVQLLRSTLMSNSVLLAALRNPIIALEKKSAILNELFSSKVTPLTVDFLKLLVAKGRAGHLLEIARSFESLYADMKGIVTASFVTASPISKSAEKDIIAVVKEATKKEVDLDAQVNEALIGGFILTVGDKQIDTSVSGALARLKRSFIS